MQLVFALAHVNKLKNYSQFYVCSVGFVANIFP